MKRRGDRAIVITDAERSQEDQLRTRTIRYVVMMSIRIVALLVAAIVLGTRPPLWWLWLALCAVGMTVIPWVAVVLANDRLPKEQHRWRRHHPGPSRALPESRPPADAPPNRTIDSTPS